MTDHWNSKTIDFIRPYLAAARSQVRIATGFFTVQGYDLIRPALAGKHVYVLVGYDEDSKERLRQKLIDDVMEHLSRWDAPNRREAVQDLVDKLEHGEFHIIEEPQEVLDARIRQRDHAKVYIVDDAIVLVGSSNLTVSGLRNNAEGMAAVDEPERVRHWRQQFEGYWNAPDTYDLTQELLEALRRWLGLHNPYDVYLKTILALIPEDEIRAPREAYKMPVRYQLVVVERLLRQLQEWRGAMLVASTGLGKTIMATHTAYRLARAGEIMNVIVFAPKQVQPDWEQALRSAGLSYQVFTRNLLDQPRSRSKKRKTKKVDIIERALAEVDDRYIIFVDESQYFINRLRAHDGTVRHSFRRLLELAGRKNPYIMLLTATPMARGVQDLNNQLALLPHTAAPAYVRESGQMVIPEMGAHLVEEPRAWKVHRSDEFFENFINLPVCTVISTSQVAKNFATATPEGDYVEFEDGRRWIPQIELRKVKVPVPLEREMSAALDGGYFKHKLRTFRIRGQWKRSESTIEEQARVAWASSPLALREVIRQTIDGTYEAKFIYSEETRGQALEPILQALQQLDYHQDAKFMALCYYLRQCRDQGRKVVVFTERLATAVYLEQALAQEIPDLRVANVVRQNESGGYDLKDFEKEVLDLICDFAPEANRDKIPPEHEGQLYDLLISTDAYGVGVNLQDASVVISYDLAWTPEPIIQRAGRILRFWTQPRRVHLYVFVGRFQERIAHQHESQRVEDRLRQLTQRTRQAEKFSELPIIPEQEIEAYPSLGSLSNVTIEDLGLADVTAIEEFTGVSAFLRHINELNRNMVYAKAIPDDISSALRYPEDRARLYLLLRGNQEYYWTLYDIAHRELERVPEDQLLRMIQCRPETPVAEVDPNGIEELAQRCKDKWARKQGLNPDDIERICALYLMPEHAPKGLAEMLKEAW